MIEVKWWCEREGAYFCRWDDTQTGYLNEDDLQYEKERGEEIIWECA
ncbi:MULTISPECIES: hypothetical protein [Vibrio harveyi group]|uniref:Uncharacterized protein n=2 Tax=Vibrio harveyi group TaxID=717610 RepID=A0AA47JEH1_VIBPH|nr:MULTISPECIES: hypothetical protein [Vibrio harveyi group]EDL68362.1 conserved hypothetical protein [Vibrio campbellii HY01]HDM8167561.1 hypothetical protein [Vibrio harveyi]ARR05760.1 hypothetical protein Vc3S01_0998 [Vibrio campbellii]EIO2936158.1 hypothetical protein [Vibrio parahaemolyticus]EJE4227740.1 hypothetical protein [Vibrio parahaemolyticus]